MNLPNEESTELSREETLVKEWKDSCWKYWKTQVPGEIERKETQSPNGCLCHGLKIIKKKKKSYFPKTSGKAMYWSTVTETAKRPGEGTSAKWHFSS